VPVVDRGRRRGSVVHFEGRQGARGDRPRFHRRSPRLGGMVNKGGRQRRVGFV